MAISSEVSSLDNIEDFSMDDLLDSFNEPYLKYKSLNGKCKSINKSFMDISLEKELISNENDELRNRNKTFEIENDNLKNELNIMKGRIDVLENDIASIKVKGESWLNDVSEFTLKKKSFDVRKHRSKIVHRKIIPYENGFVRGKDNDKFEFIIKKVENVR